MLSTICTKMLTSTLAGGLYEDHFWICHILTLSRILAWIPAICEKFEIDLQKKFFFSRQGNVFFFKNSYFNKMKLRIITKKCSRFSDTVFNKIDFIKNSVHRDPPPAWVLISSHSSSRKNFTSFLYFEIFHFHWKIKLYFFKTSFTK